MDIFTKKFEISFADINENNKLSNKGILRLMQEIAGIHSGTVGYGLNDMPKTHFGWVILNWKLRVFSRPKWNTVLTINTWSRKITPLFAYRDFEIYDDKNNLVAIATSKWILFDVYKQSICKITPDIENLNFVYEYKIGRRDIDTNHHVNNINYLDYAYEAIPQEKLLDFSNIEIMYKHEARIGDTISVFYSYTGNNEHIITIKDKERKNLHTILKLF